MIDLERKFNNHHKRNIQWIVISASLLMALSIKMTIAKANTINNYAMLKTGQSQFYNDKLFNHKLWINPNSIAVDSMPTYNLSEVDKQSDALRQRILLDNVSQSLNLPRVKNIVRSFNANHVLNISKTFRKTLIPQTLQLPRSSDKNRVAYSRSTFAKRLQILIILYAILRNFVNMLKIRKKASNDVMPLIKQKPRLIKITITFQDVYSKTNDLKIPVAITKKGAFGSRYSVSAPNGWILINQDGTFSKYRIFYYRDGNQTLDIVPYYKGIAYKYNQDLKHLEFTLGRFDSINISLPPDISLNSITSIKFDKQVHIDSLNLSNLFNKDPYLQSINIKGHIINRDRQFLIIRTAPKINNKDSHAKNYGSQLNRKTSRQAELNALNELSIMIGSLSNEDHSD